MSSTTNTNTNLNNIVYGAIAISIVALLIFLYYSNYVFFDHFNLTFEWLDNALIANGSIFQDAWKCRLLLCVGAGAGLLFPYSRRKDSVSIYYLFIFIACFLALQLLVYAGANLFTQALNIIFSFFCFIGIISRFISLAAYFNITPSLKDNVKFADGFEQNQVLIENEHSFHLEYSYKYLGKSKKGIVNIINPFRGAAVIGSPGSGKTYVFIEEPLRQAIDKGYCAVVYDFKDPTLSSLTYEYLCAKKKRTPNYNMSFKYISFKDMHRTHRCNPLKGILSSSDAIEFANVILIALNKKMAEKQGEFFTESSKNFTALNILLLAKVLDGNYCSLPHLIQLISQKSALLFPIYDAFAIFNIDALKLFAPFEQAFNNGALEQLSGQIASAQIGLGTLSDENLSFVLTESEDYPEQNISLDINDPLNPSVICLGNNPQKQIIYGLANSVILARIGRYINNEKKHKCFYCIDELPTVYIDGITTLIATGRSNKLVVMIGMQDYSQLIRDYSRDFANALTSICGNIFAGSVQGETAKSLSSLLGQKNVKKISTTLNEDGGISTSTSEQKESRISEEHITTLSQGNFIGKVSDNFGEEQTFKIFSGKFNVDPKYKKVNHQIPIVRHDDEALRREISDNNFRITDNISSLFNSFNPLLKQLELLKLLGDYDAYKKYIKFNRDFEILCLAMLEYGENLYIDANFISWLEIVVLTIQEYKALNIVNDTMSDFQKISLLLRSTFKGGTQEQIIQILDIIKKYELTNFEGLVMHQESHLGA